MSVIYLELLTGEQFLYEAESPNENLFEPSSKVLLFDKKRLYRVIGRTKPDGTATFGFVRMDNDFFPPLAQVSIANDRVAMTYMIEPNSDVYRGFEAAKVKEAAKSAGLVLVK